MQEGHEAEEKEIPLHERKKAVPQHVQDLLKQHSTVDNPLADENRRTVADFKGLGTEKKRNTVLVKTELYVRGLPFSMSGKELRELFEGFQPKYARVMRHAKYKDRSLGYGFVGFKTEAKAEEAMKAMDGHEVTTPDGGKEKTMTLRISYAQERGKKRLLSSRTGRREAQMTIEMRKAQMGMRDMRNVAMTMDEMPRRWKALADQKGEMNPQLRKAKTSADDDVLDDERAERAIEDYLTLHQIEDVDSGKLAREAKEALDDEDDEAGKMLYGIEEDSEDDDDWLFIPDGQEEKGEKGPEMKLEDFIEDEEEERRNWEEYQRMQRLNKDNLKDDSDVKPSGALRSGQKKPKAWTRDE